MTTKPGAWVRARTARRENLIAVGVLTGLGVVALYFALVAAHVVGTLAAVTLGGMFLFVRGPAERYIEQHRRLTQGTVAEEAVGATLEQLKYEGWKIMPDVMFGGEGNLDAVVSGPGGVFLIETKANRYRSPELQKVKRQAAKLHDELGVWVTPVICLHTRRGSAFKTKGVWVVPHPVSLGWLRRQHNKPLEFELLARFADKL